MSRNFILEESRCRKFKTLEKDSFFNRAMVNQGKQEEDRRAGEKKKVIGSTKRAGVLGRVCKHMGIEGEEGEGMEEEGRREEERIQIKVALSAKLCCGSLRE